MVSPMIIGIGLDIVETERHARAQDAEHGPRFEERVFTPAEREECAARVDRAAAYAARFAAKEACLKALGTGWAQGLAFRQVEVVRGAAGEPHLRLSGAAEERARRMGVRRVHVSLSHERGMAAAMVLLEG
jgi:holo-[acyl-carrier protein] synthase